MVLFLSFGRLSKVQSSKKLCLFWIREIIILLIMVCIISLILDFLSECNLERSHRERWKVLTLQETVITEWFKRRMLLTVEKLVHKYNWHLNSCCRRMTSAEICLLFSSYWRMNLEDLDLHLALKQKNSLFRIIFAPLQLRELLYMRINCGKCKRSGVRGFTFNCQWMYKTQCDLIASQPTGGSPQMHDNPGEVHLKG